MQLDNILNNSDEQTFWRRYGHLGDAYMKSRRKAENAALDLAITSEDEAVSLFLPNGQMKHKCGERFACFGMWDASYGVQFFALDYETEQDRAEVSQWIKALE